MGGREGVGYLGEWEHALALVMACRYLPIQLLASPGERAGTVQCTVGGVNFHKYNNLVEIITAIVKCYVKKNNSKNNFFNDTF